MNRDILTNEQKFQAEAAEFAASCQADANRLTGAQLTAASTLALSIQGTSSHNHMLELSSDEIGQIRAGQTFTKESTGTGHKHMVTFN